MPESFGSTPVGAVVQPCPITQGIEDQRYWIEIQLTGEDDQPVPWEAYEVTLPDGIVVPGFLDDQGLARFEGIVGPGDCQVRFPALDRDAWTPVAAKVSMPEAPGTQLP